MKTQKELWRQSRKQVQKALRHWPRKTPIVADIVEDPKHGTIYKVGYRDNDQFTEITNLVGPGAKKTSEGLIAYFNKALHH